MSNSTHVYLWLRPDSTISSGSSYPQPVRFALWLAVG